MLQRSFILASAMALSSCTTIENTIAGDPADVSPTLPTVPESWANASETIKAADAGDWLQQFDDAGLISVVEEALVANPNILPCGADAGFARQN
ncbi:MAG: hypothetical protein AAFS13_10590, partial [Pseudomonadota bacterium]